MLNKFKCIVITGITAFTLSACGGDDKKNEAPAAAPQTPPAKPDDTPKGVVADGKFYLSAGSVEAFDNQGNKLDPQTLQITGDYTWSVEFLGENKYQITATGSTKINSQNQILAEVNCKGAQDIYVFELTESKAVRNLRTLESGCPGTFKPTASMQMTFEPLTEKSFIYNVTTQSDGLRIIESYTFKM